MMETVDAIVGAGLVGSFAAALTAWVVICACRYAYSQGFKLAEADSEINEEVGHLRTHIAWLRQALRDIAEASEYNADLTVLYNKCMHAAEASLQDVLDDVAELERSVEESKAKVGE